MTDADLDELLGLTKHDEWLRAIGEHFLYFGEIEWFTYDMLVLLPTENIFDSVKKLRLNRRGELVVALLKENGIDQAVIEEVECQLETAVDHSDIRNTLAHNPLRVSIYMREEKIAFLSHRVSKFTSPEKEITLQRIKDANSKLKDVVKKLFECHAKIRAAYK